MLSFNEPNCERPRCKMFCYDNYSFISTLFSILIYTLTWAISWSFDSMRWCCLTDVRYQCRGWALKCVLGCTHLSHLVGWTWNNWSFSSQPIIAVHLVRMQLMLLAIADYARVAPFHPPRTFKGDTVNDIIVVLLLKHHGAGRQADRRTGLRMKHHRAGSICF